MPTTNSITICFRLPHLGDGFWDGNFTDEEIGTDLEILADAYAERLEGLYPNAEIVAETTKPRDVFDDGHFSVEYDPDDPDDETEAERITRTEALYFDASDASLCGRCHDVYGPWYMDWAVSTLTRAAQAEV